jgi:DNA-binding GntR family transcriptional regulator
VSGERSDAQPTRTDLQRTILSDQAYHSVRSAILSGQVPYGTQLVVRDLVGSLGLSPTPIQRALTLLEREGLVVSIPYRGFFVPTFDVSDVLQIFSVREALERKAARLAALHADRGVLDRIGRVVGGTERPRNRESALELGLGFHRLLFEASRNVHLLDMAHSILSRTQFLHASSPATPRADERIRSEHLRVLAAVVARDPDEAELAVSLHVRNACVGLVERFEGGATLAATLAGEDLGALSETALTLIERQSVPPTLPEGTLPHEALEHTLSDHDKERLRSALTHHIGPAAIFVCSDALSRTSDLAEALALMKSRIPSVEGVRDFEARIVGLF